MKNLAIITIAVLMSSAAPPKQVITTIEKSPASVEARGAIPTEKAQDAIFTRNQ